MEKNLIEVWNQRNASARMDSIKALYAQNAVLYEMGEAKIGFEPINNQVSTLLNSMPGNFEFVLKGPVVINADMGRLYWAVGPKGEAPVQLGMDIALFEREKIKALYVFLENH